MNGVRKEMLLGDENKVNWSGDYRACTGIQVCKTHGGLSGYGNADRRTGKMAG